MNYSMNRLMKWKLYRIVQTGSLFIICFHRSLKLILRPPLTLTLFFKFVIITIVMMIIILINDNNNLLLLLLLSELKGENQISLFGIS